MGILSKSKADDFNLIYKRLAPLSHYGKELKNKFLQFSNDDYKLAKSYFRKLEKVINWEKNNKSKIQYIRAKLEKITDIDQYLNSLESQELFNVNFYQLRKFANNSYDILEELNDSFFKEDFYKYYLDLSKVKNIFDKFCDKPLGFHISSQKFKKLKEIKNAIETKTIKKQSI